MMDKQAIGLARRAYEACVCAAAQRENGDLLAAEVNEARAEESVRGMVRDFGVPRGVAEDVMTYAVCGVAWDDVVRNMECDTRSIRAEGGDA